MHLTWLRSDLRIDDNTALSASTERGPTIALWLVSPGQWQAHDDAACKVDFWLRNLHDLRQSLEKLNIPLLIRTFDTWDQAPQAVLDVCRQHQVQSVHWNEEYGINEQRRDDATRALLEKSAIQAHSYLDQLFFRPGTVLTRSGDYFQVFSQFKKTCLEHLHRSLPAVSKHLKVLERAKLISRGRSAQWRPYRLEPEPLKAVDGWLGDYRKLWEQRFDRLEEYLAAIQKEREDVKEDET